MPPTPAFVSDVPDIAAFEALLHDYYVGIRARLLAAGGPGIDPAALARANIDDMDSMLPPHGRLALVHGADGQLVGCGAMRRIRPDAVEMKRLFVRPEARRGGLGRRLVEMRIEEARRMGCTGIYADTVRGNAPMLALYETLGFRQIPRYPENANTLDMAPYLHFLERRLDADSG